MEAKSDWLTIIMQPDGLVVRQFDRRRNIGGRQVIRWIYRRSEAIYCRRSTAAATNPVMETASFDALTPEDVEPVEVGPGCFRRDLPSTAGARAWIVDIEPGSQWPYEDLHDVRGEQVWVVSGELIEGDRRFGAGTYLNYGPDSRHRPRTESGVRLFGFNVTAE